MQAYTVVISLYPFASQPNSILDCCSFLGAEEETLHATFPSEWFVIKDASSSLSIISSTMGTKIDELDSLMVFNGQGSVMHNPDATRLVYQLKECMFPWKVDALESYKKDNFNQPGLKFLSDARLVSKKADGGVALVEDGRSAADILMNNDLVGLYFSAHWCGPCRGFTPVFAEVYTLSTRTYFYRLLHSLALLQHTSHTLMPLVSLIYPRCTTN